jgi:RNA polymerase sigma-70 factor, ECF subfamily
MTQDRDSSAPAVMPAAETAARPGPHVADLRLASACLQGAPGAMRVFETRVMAEAQAAFRRLRLDRATADDLAQHLRERLLVGGGGGRPKLAEYGGRGPLGGWVRVVATRMALNVLRDRRARPAFVDRVAAVGSGGDPELSYLRARYGGHLTAALERAMGTLTAEQRILLRMSYVEGLGTGAIGNLLGKHPVTVLRSRTRILQTLRARTCRLLQDDLGCGRSVAASIVNLALSQVELSMLGSREDAPEGR